MQLTRFCAHGFRSPAHGEEIPVLGPYALGHGGTAGARVFASPRLGIGYGYGRNRFALGDSAEKENILLIDEVVRAIGRIAA